MKFVWTKQEIKDFLDEQPIECRYSIEKYSATRSINQNQYYFWVIVEILRNEFWETASAMHENLKYLFLKDFTWKFVKVKDSKSLNTKQFEDYLTNIKQWASMEHWIVLPDPNQITN